MNTTDKLLLKEAAGTIRGLRQENATLRARLSGFEDALLLLNTAPAYRAQGMMHPDIVNELEKRVEEADTVERINKDAASKGGMMVAE